MTTVNTDVRARFDVDGPTVAGLRARAEAHLADLMPDVSWSYTLDAEPLVMGADGEVKSWRADVVAYVRGPGS